MSFLYGCIWKKNSSHDLDALYIKYSFLINYLHSSIIIYADAECNAPENIYSAFNLSDDQWDNLFELEFRDTNLLILSLNFFVFGLWQMYRTIKTADKATAFSGQFDVG